MLLLVDSCGWIECFTGGPRSGAYAPPIERPGDLVVPSISLAEVHRWLLRWPQAQPAERYIAPMRRGALADLTPRIAALSATLGQQYRLAPADSLVYAHALAAQATLLTHDAALGSLPGAQHVTTP